MAKLVLSAIEARATVMVSMSMLVNQPFSCKLLVIAQCLLTNYIILNSTHSLRGPAC
jgi:hypothetical protein